ncbi:MAG: hypothetical protein E7379_00090 [Clostridiales bacterium]|nr:hypothetical protein [Clostridiales bacterium]
MNYQENFNNENWESQCNFPQDWNCDCDHNNSDKKIFYGYFVGTQYPSQNNDDNCDRKETTRCEEKRPETNRCRTCRCPFCCLFRRFH